MRRFAACFLITVSSCVTPADLGRWEEAWEQRLGQQKQALDDLEAQRITRKEYDIRTQAAERQHQERLAEIEQQAEERAEYYAALLATMMGVMVPGASVAVNMYRDRKRRKRGEPVGNEHACG